MLPQNLLLRKGHHLAQKESETNQGEGPRVLLLETVVENRGLPVGTGTVKLSNLGFELVVAERCVTHCSSFSLCFSYSEGIQSRRKCHRDVLRLILSGESTTEPAPRKFSSEVKK